MDRIAVLFPASGADLADARDDWKSEYEACAGCDLFMPVLYDEDGFAGGSDLKVSSPAPSKKTYCIRRGRALSGEEDDRMAHALKRMGYEEAFRSLGMTLRPWKEPPSGSPRIEEFKPKTLLPYHRHRSDRRKGYVWSPDPHVYRTFGAAVAKGPSGILRDGSGDPIVFEQLPWYEVDQVIASMCNEPLDKLNDTFWNAPVWFERFIDIAKVGGAPVEWRAFFYEGRLVYRCPKHAGSTSIPEPPAEMFGPVRADASFRAIDFAEDASGRWWVLGDDCGDYTHVPAGGSPSRFYERLAQEIERGADYPDWCWCLVADVVPDHRIGEDKITVPGSRHFGPGTKVCFSNGFWGLGAERCTVVGIPKYSDYPVGVVVRTDLLRNFRLERVTDPALLKALYTNRLREPFERDRRTWVEGLWSTTDEDRAEIEKLADMFNKRMRDIDAGRPD